jgi:predicted transcriptional regulator
MNEVEFEELYQKIKDRLIADLYVGGIKSRGCQLKLPIRENSKLYAEETLSYAHGIPKEPEQQPEPEYKWWEIWK